MIGLVVPSQGDAAKALNALNWIAEKAPMEWAQLFASDVLPLMRRKGTIAAFVKLLAQQPKLKEFIAGFRDILTR